MKFTDIPYGVPATLNDSKPFVRVRSGRIIYDILILGDGEGALATVSTLIPNWEKREDFKRCKDV